MGSTRPETKIEPNLGATVRDGVRSYAVESNHGEQEGD
jgi:hypothetical protein